MELKFDSELDYQKEAIASIVDIFNGQRITQSNFTVLSNIDEVGTVGKLVTEHGVGNKLELDEEDMLKNVNKIQLKNGLKQSTLKELQKDNYYFTVEMETGTGKTYVYLRTIYEYKSQKLDVFRDFATSDNIRIMVMTIQSINMDTNVINIENEKTNGLKPIEFLQETNPIIIIDEPQTTISTDNQKDSVNSLNPLCKIGYSATHKDKINLMYRLNAVDAYEKQLVKQIEVASLISRDSHNEAYIKLISVSNKNNKIRAKIQFDKWDSKKGDIVRTTKEFKFGDDLKELSGNREIYNGYIITEINAKEGNEFVDFSGADIIRLGEVRGEVNDDIVKRTQIRKTIEEHLNKELVLKQHGIKVLSLFFIDRVANYRYYDEKGNPHKGQ